MGYVIAQYYQVEPAHTRPVDLDAMLNEADKEKHEKLFSHRSSWVRMKRL